MSIAISGSSITFPDQTQMSTAVGGSFRNRIINGDMRIWQRGTSFTGIGSVYTADRFVCILAGLTATVTQSTDIPNAKESYSLKFVPASNGTPSEFVVRQYMERQNIADFAGSTVTVSAWVKCSKTSVKLRCRPLNATGGGDVAQNIVVVANTWTRITATFSTFSTVTAWTSTPEAVGGFLDIGFQDGIALTTADELYITGVQLEQGSTATEFERRPIGTELALCQRYFYIHQFSYQGYAASAGTAGTTSVPFKSSMRSIPITTLLNSPNYLNASSASIDNVNTESARPLATTGVGSWAVFQATFSFNSEV
jgi:hypothetical protein